MTANERWIRCWVAVFGLLLFGSINSTSTGQTQWSFSPFYTEKQRPFQEVRDLLYVDDALWIATWGGGVTRVEGTSWRHYDQTNGLPGNWTYAIAADQSGNIWVGTADGLARIRDGKMDVYTNESVGVFPSNSIRSIVLRSDGKLWLSFDDSSDIIQCDPQLDPIWTKATVTGSSAGSKKFLFVDQDGVTWCSCSTGELYRYVNKQ